MDSSKADQEIINGYEEKVVKLKKMRLTATGLLVLMAVVYLAFKRFESVNLVYSSIVAFAEAAMIGSLADWFAVVALFKHPLGLKWFPHTAILPKNRDKLADSISGFVISNFFSEENISERLRNIDFSEELLVQLSKNKEAISTALHSNVSAVAGILTENGELTAGISDILKDRLKDMKANLFLGNLVELLVSSGYHTVIVKNLLEFIYKEVKSDKEKTLQVVESVDRKLGLPIVRDIVYRSIVDSLEKNISEYKTPNSNDMDTMVKDSLAKFTRDLKSSPKLMGDIEKIKTDILESESFSAFFTGTLEKTKTALLTYGESPDTKLPEDFGKLMDKGVDYLIGNLELRLKINEWIKDRITGLITEYSDEIGKLISNTVKDWKVDDMVEKLEVQVGGDLQYIRINGAIIGGLAGLGIHLLSELARIW